MEFYFRINFLAAQNGCFYKLRARANNGYDVFHVLKQIQATREKGGK